MLADDQIEAGRAKRRKLTQWQRVGGMLFALGATLLILANEFKDEFGWLRDADLRLMSFIGSVNPFQITLLFFQGLGDYFSGCPSGVAGDCPGATSPASFFTAIGHGFDFIYARTPEVPLKPALMAGAFIGSWYLGARMAKNQGADGNFFWIVPGLVALSLCCFAIQGVLWLLAASAFVVFAALAVVGGAVSVAVIAVLKSTLAASEAKKAVQITEALVTGKDLEG